MSIPGRCHVMPLRRLLIFLYILVHIHGSWGVVYKELEQELSPGAYNSLIDDDGNQEIIESVSSVTRSFNISALVALTRRWSYTNSFYRLDYKWYRVQRICYAISAIYRSAMVDIRRYYPIRDLYIHTQEYEIGYVINQIVYRYQIVLELFHTIRRRFWENNRVTRNIAPVPYMFYIYTNIVWQCTTIMKLCNMLHEVEEKYKKSEGYGPFDDYHLYAKKKNMQGGINPMPDARNDQLAYLAKIQRERQQRLKNERKWQREKQKQGIWEKPEYERRPRRDPRHDLIYGWSIEYW